MCGVWGAIRKLDNGFDQDDLNLLRDFMVVGAQRGLDGTGVTGVLKNGERMTLKKGANPFWIMFNKDFESKMIPALFKEGRMYMGHNRYATKGKINDANAHPFVHGPITFMHNGTIREGLDIPTDEVDSNLLGKMVAEVGPEKAFGDIRGAWTAIWHNAEDNTINFLRNGERPLCMVENHFGIYWASEKKMLEWLLHENKVTNYKERFFGLDNLLSINLKDLSETTKKVEGKKYTYTSHYKGGTTYTYGHDISTGGPEEKKAGPQKGAEDTSSTGTENTSLSKRASKDTVCNFVITAVLPTKNKKAKEFKAMSDRGEKVEFLCGKDNIGVGQWFTAPVKGFKLINGTPIITIQQKQMKSLAKKPLLKLLPPASIKSDNLDEVLPPEQNNDNEVVEMLDGVRHTRRTLRLINNSLSGCPSCNNTVEERDFERCSSLLSRQNSLMGIICPTCTELALREPYHFYQKTQKGMLQ